MIFPTGLKITPFSIKVIQFVSQACSNWLRLRFYFKQIVVLKLELFPPLMLLYFRLKSQMILFTRTKLACISGVFNNSKLAKAAAPTRRICRKGMTMEQGFIDIFVKSIKYFVGKVVIAIDYVPPVML
jgi:hypothetical protein